MMSLLDNEIASVFAKSFLLKLELLILQRIASGVAESTKSCGLLLNVEVLGNTWRLDGLLNILSTFTLELAVIVARSSI